MPAMTTRAREPRAPHARPGARAATISPRKGAAWLQRRIHRDETGFRRRTGAADGLSRLRSVSEALVHRVDGDRVDLVLGRILGGFQAFVSRFYRDHWAVFCASVLPEGSLRVERVKSGTITVADVRQYLDGIPVNDARWTLVFDRDGHLT